MRRIIAGTLALTVLSSTWLLGSEGTAKKKKAAVKKEAGPTVSQQLQSMKDQLNQQQQQINQLQQQLQQSNQSLQSAQQQLQSGVQSANQQAQAAQAAAASAQAAATANSGDVASLKTTSTTISQTLAVTQKEVKELQSPLAIKYKGVTITPVGFFDVQAIWRNKNVNSDLSVGFTSIPLTANNGAGASNALLHEFHMNAKPSRVGLLAEGQVNPTMKATGYIEFDEGSTIAGPNAQESSPWIPRLRQAWAMVDTKSGWNLTAGQDWMLWTPDRRGIGVRQEWIPVDLEYNIMVGYPYKREPEIRLTKNFNNKVFFAIAASNNEATFASGGNGGTAVPTSVLGLNISSNAGAIAGGGIIPQFNGFSTEGNSVTVNQGQSNTYFPDIIAKVAFDPGFGHYELKAMGRVFHDSVLNAGGNEVRDQTKHTTYGWGLGTSFIVPVTKKVDFVGAGQIGAGISSYNSSDNTDVTLNGSLGLSPVRSASGIVGVEAHPSPKLDVYAYAGDEYYQRQSYTCNVAVVGAGVCNGFGTVALTTSTTGVATPVVSQMGYGNPNFAPGTNNRDLAMGSVGYYYRFFRGSYGTFQQGLNFNYYWRATWAGTATAVLPSTLKGNDQSAILDLRYILP